MRIESLRRRSFVARYLALFGGEVTSKLFVLLAFGYLARVMGPRDFGAIELALSITIFFVLGTETGLGSYGARIVETTPALAPQLLVRSGLVRLMLSVPAYLLLLLSARLDVAATGLLPIFGVLVLLTPFNTQWVFQGLRQMHWVAAGSFLRYGTFAAVVLLLVHPGSDPRFVAIAEVSGALVLAVLNTILLRSVLRVRPDWRGAWRGAIAVFKRAWFLGASDLTWATMWYAPTIIVGWIAAGRSEEVAWIAAAVRIVMALHTFVWLYFFNMLPNLAKELREGVENWRRLMHLSLSISMWAACFVALAGTLTGPSAIPALFGQAYSLAVTPFQIIVWMIPVAWLSGHFRFSLIAAGHQHLEFMASAVAGVTTILLVMIAAAFYGAAGAAAGLLTAGVVNALVAGAAMRRVIGPCRLGFAGPAVLACAAAMTAAVVASWTAGETAGAIVGLGAYGVAAATQWDVTRFRNAWQGRML